MLRDKLVLTVTIFFLCLSSLACSTHPAAPKNPEQHCSLSPIPSPCPDRLLLLIHGLNNSIHVFDDFIQSSSIQSNSLVFLNLRGHEEGKRIPLESAQDWVNDVRCAREQLQSSCPHSSLSVMTYSLGALPLLRDLSTQNDMPYHAMLLVAPPLQTSILSLPLYALLPLSNTGLSLPSLTPEHIRAKDRTPLKHYRAAITLQESIITSAPPFSGKTRVPLCLALNPSDRVIEARGVIHEARRWNLDTLSIIELPASSQHYGHLVLEQESYSNEDWLAIISRFQQCLALPSS